LSESYIQLPPDGTGKKLRAIYYSNLDAYEEVQLCKDIETANPIYVVAVSASAVAANKHHLTLWNGSANRVRVIAIIVAVHNTAAVSGYIMQFLLYRASAVSGGTALTIDMLDPDDPPPPSGIAAYTGATVTVTGTPLAIFTPNPEETGALPWIYFQPPKPIVVKPNTGLTIQQYGTAGAGLFNAVIYFSVEGVKP
jgi:uncharacterized membrane protein YwzB